MALLTRITNTDVLDVRRDVDEIFSDENMQHDASDILGVPKTWYDKTVKLKLIITLLHSVTTTNVVIHQL